jgi:hypothetical protein
MCRCCSNEQNIVIESKLCNRQELVIHHLWQPPKRTALMNARRGTRPGNQHRFAKTRSVDFCDPKLDEWVGWQLAARLAPATGKHRAANVDNFAREAGVNPVTATSADLMAWFADRDDLSRTTSALYFRRNVTLAGQAHDVHARGDFRAQPHRAPARAGPTQR